MTKQFGRHIAQGRLRSSQRDDQGIQGTFNGAQGTRWASLKNHLGIMNIHISTLVRRTSPLDYCIRKLSSRSTACILLDITRFRWTMAHWFWVGGVRAPKRAKQPAGGGGSASGRAEPPADVVKGDYLVWLRRGGVGGRGPEVAKEARRGPRAPRGPGRASGVR